MDETQQAGQNPGVESPPEEYAPSGPSTPAITEIVETPPEAGSGGPDDAVERFGPDPRALRQRRALGTLLGVLAAVALAVTLVPAAPLAPALRAAAAGLAAALLGSVIRALRSSPLGGREVLLRPQALELRRAGFRRLVVFESVRHMRIVQHPGGRLLSMRLDLDDDSVTLRDVESLGRLFAAAAQRRGPGVLIEVEERRVDWGEPLPWMLLFLGLAAAVALGAAAGW